MRQKYKLMFTSQLVRLGIKEIKEMDPVQRLIIWKNPFVQKGKE